MLRLQENKVKNIFNNILKKYIQQYLTDFQ